MSRIDNIKKYAEQELNNAKNIAIQEQHTRETLIAQIQALKPRIAELIETAQACVENGIYLFGNENSRTGNVWHKIGFIADHTYHKTGFLRSADEKKEFVCMGILAGGACGNWNFATDGDVVRDYYRDETQEPSLEHLQQFVDEFDDFEETFYAYVDKITGSVTDNTPANFDNLLYNIAKLQKQEELLKNKLNSMGFLEEYNWEITGLFEHCSVSYRTLFDQKGNDLGTEVIGEKDFYARIERDPNTNDVFGEYFYKVDKETYVRVGIVNKRENVTDADLNTDDNALYHIAVLQKEAENLKEKAKKLKEKLEESGSLGLPVNNWEVVGFVYDCYTDYSSARYEKKGNEYSLFTRSGKELGVEIEGQKGVYGHIEPNPNDITSFYGEYFYRVENGTYIKVSFSG